MDGDQIRRGSTLLIAGTHQDPERSHLCIVLNDPPDASPQQVLYVPVITARKKSDTTCVLDVGDHDFIVRKSCVHYARADVRTVEHLAKCGSLRSPLTDDVLERVCAGIFDSPYTRPWVKEFYEDNN